MATARFDLGGLFEAVDAERRRRGLSWATLGRQVGVAPSTIRRFQHADDAEADGVLALVRWLDTAPEHYVPNGVVAGRALPIEGDGHGYVRVDLDLVVAATGDPRSSWGRTRTTIQRLVDAGQRSGRAVGSLTRWSVA